VVDHSPRIDNIERLIRERKILRIGDVKVRGQLLRLEPTAGGFYTRLAEVDACAQSSRARKPEMVRSRPNTHLEQPLAARRIEACKSLDERLARVPDPLELLELAGTLDERDVGRAARGGVPVGAYFVLLDLHSGVSFVAADSSTISANVHPMLRLHLVRHGDTPHASDGRLAGAVDPSLTERGLQQAEILGRTCARLGMTALYTSPLLRARMTSAPIATACRVEPVIDDGLREIAYGEWEGISEAELRANHASAFTAWTTEPALNAPPGGESAFAVASRALAVFVRAHQAHPTGIVGFVSHRTAIRVLACALTGVPIGRFRERFACPTASITTFDFGERGITLVGLGDVHHLQGVSA
jgi:probable phosphoglycerate mutase